VEKILRKKLPKGRFVRVKPAHRRLMQGVRGKGNRTTEARLRGALARAGIRGWKMHYSGLRGRPDFFFPAKSVAVFVDGCFWHGCRECGHIPSKNAGFWKAKISRNRQRDKRTTAELEKSGCVVLRFWEHDLRDSLRDCVDRITSVLDE